MKESLKIFSVDFEGIWSAGRLLILAAYDQKQAEQMAKETIKHTNVIEVTEIDVNDPMVIVYLDGDY